jgi:hypothetical protein
MSNDMEVPKVVNAKMDELLQLTCPRCHVAQAFQMKRFLRGLNYVCHGCGMHVQTSPGASIESGVLTLKAGDETTDLLLVNRHDGIWILLDEDEKSLLASLDLDSERGIAIIVGTMIEERLRRALLAKSNRNKIIEARLFHPSGPMGSFSSKIDLAYLIGMISSDAHHDLTVLKNIRNAFAHKLDIKNFGSRSIKDKAANFRLIESHVGDLPLTGKPEPMASFNIGSTPALFVTHLDMRIRIPKERYIITAQLLTIKFASCELKNCVWPFI